MGTPKIALITGSTSGIGLGIAQSFAQRGYKIMLNGLDPEAAHSHLMQQLVQQGAAAVAYRQADIAVAQNCQMLVDHTEAEFGALDVIVNNAGVQHVAPIEELSEDQFTRILHINLFSHFHIYKRALPGMRKRGWGRLIGIASTHGLVASANKSAYVAAKHGVVGLVKTLALETAGSGITCNAICPGWVLTPLVRQQIELRAAAQGCSFDHAKDQLVSEKHPSRDFVTPEQVGELTAFVASDAAAQMTGSAVTMDGGWTCQ